MGEATQAVRAGCLGCRCLFMFIVTILGFIVVSKLQACGEGCIGLANMDDDWCNVILTPEGAMPEYRMFKIDTQAAAAVQVDVLSADAQANVTLPFALPADSNLTALGLGVNAPGSSLYYTKSGNCELITETNGSGEYVFRHIDGQPFHMPHCKGSDHHRFGPLAVEHSVFAAGLFFWFWLQVGLYGIKIFGVVAANDEANDHPNYGKLVYYALSAFSPLLYLYSMFLIHPLQTIRAHEDCDLLILTEFSPAAYLVALCVLIVMCGCLACAAADGGVLSGSSIVVLFVSSTIYLTYVWGQRVHESILYFFLQLRLDLVFRVDLPGSITASVHTFRILSFVWFIFEIIGYLLTILGIVELVGSDKGNK